MKNDVIRIPREEYPKRWEAVKKVMKRIKTLISNMN